MKLRECKYSWLWIASFLVPGLVQFALSSGDFGRQYESPLVLFWLVVIAASGCVVIAAALLLRANRRDEPELGYIAVFFFAVSALPLVHGITTPGVIYGNNPTTMAAVVWAIPTGLLASAPMLLPERLRRRIAPAVASWWIPSAVAVISTLAVALLVLNHFDAGAASWIPVWPPGSFASIVLIALSFVLPITLGRRQLFLAQVAGTSAPLVIAAGFGFVAASAFAQLAATPYTIGFWVAHVLDISGVFAATIGALYVFRSTHSVRSVIDPVVTVDATSALELGLDPVVHTFVADLQSKDPITRDHVVRTAELAISIGEELGLGALSLRSLGMVALLHDLGKLDVPDEILNKPDRLTAAEFETIKSHTAWGEVRMRASPVLAHLALSVRSHHERVDGAGYPDALAGSAIPTYARIVSVCDAYDAMANTRQYRDGMGSERALAILQEHAGAQWDASIVDVVVRVIRRDPPESLPGKLAGVGQPTSDELQPIGCDCLPRELIAHRETVI